MAEKAAHSATYGFENRPLKPAAPDEISEVQLIWSTLPTGRAIASPRLPYRSILMERRVRHLLYRLDMRAHGGRVVGLVNHAEKGEFRRTPG